MSKKKDQKSPFEEVILSPEEEWEIEQNKQKTEDNFLLTEIRKVLFELGGKSKWNNGLSLVKRQSLNNVFKDEKRVSFEVVSIIGSDLLSEKNNAYDRAGKAAIFNFLQGKLSPESKVKNQQELKRISEKLGSVSALFPAEQNQNQPVQNQQNPVELSDEERKKLEEQKALEEKTKLEEQAKLEEAKNLEAAEKLKKTTENE